MCSWLRINRWSYCAMRWCNHQCVARFSNHFNPDFLCQICLLLFNLFISCVSVLLFVMRCSILVTYTAGEEVTHSQATTHTHRVPGSLLDVTVCFWLKTCVHGTVQVFLQVTKAEPDICLKKPPKTPTMLFRTQSCESHVWCLYKISNSYIYITRNTCK